MPETSSEPVEAARAGFYGALAEHDRDALFDRAPCGYVSTSPDGTIVSVNQTFLTLTGFTRAQLVGRRTFADLLTGGGRIYHETHHRPMLHVDGAARELALDIVRADGRRLPALVNSVLERDGDGAPHAVRIAVFDATERRGYEEELLRQRRRAEESEAHARAVARTLQAVLLPPDPPVIPGLDVGGAFRPAGHGDEIGGDFYDIFQVGLDDWVVAIGDVCGKGVDAAVITAIARHTIRASAVHLPSGADVLAELNQVIHDHGADRYCTVALVRLRRAGAGWRASICSGGHPLPRLQRRDVVSAAGAHGSLLGIFPEVHLTEVDVDLGEDDRLVLYTDGVTEARRGGVELGLAGLDAVIAGGTASASALAEAIAARVVGFQEGHTSDDLAVVVVAARTPG